MKSLIKILFTLGIFVFLSCESKSLEKEKERDQNFLNFLLFRLYQLSNRLDTRDIDIIDFEKKEFKRATFKLPFNFFLTSSIVKSNGQIIVSGGRIGSTEIGRLNYIIPSDISGIEKSIDLLDDRVGHSLTESNNGDIIVIGGSDKLKDGNLSKNIEIIDSNIASVEYGESLAQPRYFHSSIITKTGLIYIIGGLNDGGNGIVAEIEVYNPTNNTISTIGSLNAPRAYFTPFIHQDYIYIIGGLTLQSGNLEFSSAVERINLLNNDIETLTSLQIPKTDYLINKENNILQIIGGRSSSNESMNKVEIYDLDLHTSNVTDQILTNRNPKCLFKNNESIFLGYGTNDNISLTSFITKLDLENKKEHIFYDTNIVRRNPNCLKIGESKYLILGY